MEHNKIYNLSTLLRSEQIASAIGAGNHFSFRCTACGHCCRKPGSVYFTATELKKIYSYLALNKAQKRELQKKLIQRSYNGYFIHETAKACHFLGDDNRCKIYPFRPLQCRSFPYWPSIFSSAAQLEEAEKECPGMAKGSDKKLKAAQVETKIKRFYRKFLKPQKERQKFFMI